MARKVNSLAEKRRAGRPEENGVMAQSADVDQVAEVVRQLLEEGQPMKALEAIGQSTTRTPWLSNATAVCQLRLGNPEIALQVLRPLVVEGGIHLRTDVPPSFKLTFAAVLLATGNLDGFLATLNEVCADEHVAVERYREAYRRWRAGLSLWEKVKAFFGAQVSQLFTLDFPPGEVT